MISKRGVCYDLTKSPFTVRYENWGVILCFSSVNHKEKFLELREPFRETVRESLSGRFGIEVELDMLADLTLYKRVETRGYCVITIQGDFIQCPKFLKFNGRKISENALKQR